MNVRYNTTTPAYSRLKEAGFSVKDFDVFFNKQYDAFIHSVTFVCVCGTVERLSWLNDAVEHNADVAQKIEAVGAVSEEHLREDGYTEEQIKEIRKPYEAEEVEVMRE